MPWEYGLDMDWLWPKSLQREGHPKAIKAGDVEDIMDSLDAAEKVFLAMNAPARPKAKASRDMLEELARLAEADYKGAAMKKLVASMNLVNKRIDNAVKDKNRKISKESKKSLTAIGTEISIRVDNLDWVNVEPVLKKLLESGVQADKEFTLPRLPSLYAAYRKKVGDHPEIESAANLLKAWPEDPEKQHKVAGAVCQFLLDCARDMSQCTRNIVKAIDYGGDLGGLEDRDIVTIPKLNKSLVVFGNNKGNLADGKTKDDLVKMIRTVKMLADLFDEIGKRVPKGK